MTPEPRVPGQPDYLDNTARLVARAELELEAKGYPPGVVRSAIERAWGQANHWASMLDPDMRERAFERFMAAELEKADAWCLGIKKAVDNLGPAPPPDQAGQTDQPVVE
ncbi:hypothetical protein LCGC14_2752960 [marine sediment metagenome]|uniref:Uncharacterized protein n=1 Tax=marine sediment metagenome TaxID=412755 RepID=A0A0F8Z155_9ZZZZ